MLRMSKMASIMKQLLNNRSLGIVPEEKHFRIQLHKLEQDSKGVSLFVVELA